MTKAYDEKYHKEKLIKYTLDCLITGYEMDRDLWMDNQGNSIMIIHMGMNKKSIVIKSSIFHEQIKTEALKRFDGWKSKSY
jgi:hypothetical protein